MSLVKALPIFQLALPVGALALLAEISVSPDQARSLSTNELLGLVFAQAALAITREVIELVRSTRRRRAANEEQLQETLEEIREELRMRRGSPSPAPQRRRRRAGDEEER